ncbi:MULTISPECIES: branched-chain amino acid ABC transporter permease [unclassified Solwaraspora]|uniref:branched-chain amino acid ABC transporter permease n=1 Tax=unclassified Solwaraspora TaxID=2627926 RepID=UPI00248AAE8D|nr:MULTISPECIES: branched-chain amino acid ABC transporter permease [unclassified Solwaraspora]WBB94836.1 branched-chain amino acid ABC transporter permease [Solwaraspora sp. WMMA2059]WBC21278.1 branched-chain amino acid ABC transporter permease [Solwaraspora sp. WMMA2080]WJK36641.1 branched-chain amino acid ABC transporter permease [Solwaraspora sp. WMMA2065]
MDVNGLLSNFGELTTTGLTQGAIYALVALGYTLVYGVLRLINFAHSEVFIAGAFAALWTWGALGLTQDSVVSGVGQIIFYFLIAMVAAALASAATATLVERVAYRPLRKRNAPPLAFLITAIGASIVMAEAFGIYTRRLPQGLPTIVSNEPWFTVAGVPVSIVQVLTVVAALGMMIGLDFFINRSRMGRGVRAVAQDPNTAALMGVNKDRIIMIIFVMGGLMAGVAGLLYNVRIGVLTYSVGFLLGLKAFTAAVLGGIGNLRGALLGGFLLGVVENYASGLFGTQWKDFVAFAVLVVLLMFRPTGLLGESLGRARV